MGTEITNIDPEKVDKAFRDSLYRDEELTPGVVPVDAIKVQGITSDIGFHPERLQSHKDEVAAWLALLPREFYAKTGGGWSFLNAYIQADGKQWTGLHQRMEQLFQLGIGLGLTKWNARREMWNILPGGMPYVVVL